jgi:hypothetical protein
LQLFTFPPTVNERVPLSCILASIYWCFAFLIITILTGARCLFALHFLYGQVCIYRPFVLLLSIVYSVHFPIYSLGCWFLGRLVFLSSLYILVINSLSDV